MYRMQFEWDERKNRRNLIKHGISFETASLVFDDPHAIGIPDRIEEHGEERWKTIGRAGDVLIIGGAHI